MQPTEGEEDTGASSFSLKSGTDSFVSRSHDVFAGLDALEDKHSAFLKATASSRERESAGLMKEDPREDEDHSSIARDRSRSHDRSKLSKTWDSDYERRSHSRSRDQEGGQSNFRGGWRGRGGDFAFKRPNRPPHRAGRQPVPDFKKHPEKYTCYSLGDVSESDMSDKANQKAALAFLEERRLEREKQERKLAGLPEVEPKFDTSEAACSQGKITFSRPKQKKEHCEVSEKSKHSHDAHTLDTLNDSEDINDTKNRDVDSNAKDDKETNSAPSTFKARKNVKRHIRHRDSDDDSN